MKKDDEGTQKRRTSKVETRYNRDIHRKNRRKKNTITTKEGKKDEQGEGEETKCRTPIQKK